MINGTAYGVILNDRDQLEAYANRFTEDPYKSPPLAPVLYIKPRNCFRFGGAPVRLPAPLKEVEVAPTVALLFSSDVTRGDKSQVMAAVGAACLVLDVSEPHSVFFRPAVRHRARDGFLPMGDFAELSSLSHTIITSVNDKETHRWALNRLARPIADLIADVTAFMTLKAGDILLVGLPGDAPRVGAGDIVTVEMSGLPTLRAQFVAESEE